VNDWLDYLRVSIYILRTFVGHHHRKLIYCTHFVEPLWYFFRYSSCNIVVEYRKKEYPSTVHDFMLGWGMQGKSKKTPHRGRSFVGSSRSQVRSLSERLLCRFGRWGHRCCLSLGLLLSNIKGDGKAFHSS
jgi:hypothetical protein